MTSDHNPHVPLTLRLRLVVSFLLALAVAVAAAGIYVRLSHGSDLRQDVESQHVTVKVVQAQAGSGELPLILPGNVRADLEAPIYARVSGYLKSWQTDIGAQVKKGDLLAEIETPELDQQILRTRADLASAESSCEIAEVTAKRWHNLLSTDSVSRQEADEKEANAKARQDAVNAARANLESLLAQQSFQRIVAPFDGVVTERNTEIGKLITSGSNNGGALFRVVDNRRLRIYVQVPQNYSYLIKQGMKVEVNFPELPERHFEAAVLGTSKAISESSRTSTVELLMDNKDGALLSGSYAEVRFAFTSAANVYRLPVSALLFRKDGLEVATVGADDRVVLKPITVARDLGREVEVASGITATDRVIDSPADSISQGDLVRVRQANDPPSAK